jgi:hypothetical protein
MAKTAKEKVTDFLSDWLEKQMKPDGLFGEKGMLGFIGEFLKKIFGGDSGTVDTKVIAGAAATLLTQKPDPNKSFLERIMGLFGEDPAPAADGTQPPAAGAPAADGTQTETPEQKAAREAKEKADADAAQADATQTATAETFTGYIGRATGFNLMPKFGDAVGQPAATNPLAPAPAPSGPGQRQ